MPNLDLGEIVNGMKLVHGLDRNSHLSPMETHVLAVTPLLGNRSGVIFFPNSASPSIALLSVPGRDTISSIFNVHRGYSPSGEIAYLIDGRVHGQITPLGVVVFPANGPAGIYRGADAVQQYFRMDHRDSVYKEQPRVLLPGRKSPDRSDSYYPGYSRTNFRH